MDSITTDDVNLITQFKSQFDKNVSDYQALSALCAKVLASPPVDVAVAQQALTDEQAHTASLSSQLDEITTQFNDATTQLNTLADSTTTLLNALTPDEQTSYADSITAINAAMPALVAHK